MILKHEWWLRGAGLNPHRRLGFVLRPNPSTGGAKKCWLVFPRLQ